MAKITIDIPEELEFMRKVPSIQWSLIAAKILQSKIEETARFQKIVSKSKATEEDVEELTNEIKEAVWKKHSK